MRFKSQEAREIFNSWKINGSISRAEVVQYFLYARNIIEDSGARELFPTLLTFCDWQAHPQLNRKNHYAGLKRAQEIMANEALSNNIHTDLFHVFFDTYSLIREMQILNNDPINGGILNDSLLKRLVFALSEELIDKPIVRTDVLDQSSNCSLTGNSIFIRSGKLTRNHVRREDGVFAYDVALEVVSATKSNWIVLNYLQFNELTQSITSLVPFDAHLNPMHHTHHMHKFIKALK